MLRVKGFLTSDAPTAASRHAEEDAPKFERVEWRKEPGLRKLYFYAVILCVASATTGYDGLVVLLVEMPGAIEDARMLR
jgi:hypothetical protein